MSKKLHIKTYGCQMNVYDTVRMGDVMAPLGYALSDSPEDADLVILNTCHIREKAEEKVYSDLGRVRLEQDKKKAKGEKMLIAVGGCVGQAEGEEIIRRAPYVDMVLGPQSYHQLPEMVIRALENAELEKSPYAKASGDTPAPKSASCGEATRSRRRRVVELDFPEVQKFDLLPESVSPQGASAFLAVQEGCDKFCSFCVVPYTRGAEYSRPLASLLEEAQRMVDQGTLEITLLGQNVNAYHGDDNGKTASLADLITALANINGLERIRYTTSHPRDMSDDLIAIHGSEKKLMPYLHLPIQSGSDKVLKEMNRKHTAASYMDIIHRLRAARPDIALSSDFIVGFPGESDRDFDDTMTLVQAVGFASSFSFKYSARPGTPAATDDRQIPESVKEERLAVLQALLMRQQRGFNDAGIGQRMQVLLERDGKHDGQLIGKSPYMQSVHVMDSAHLRGKLVEVAITAASTSSLTGQLTTHTQPLRKAS